MAVMDPELQAAIDTAKARVKVDPYYTKAMNGGLKGHAQGFWSGTFMGLLSGGMAGTLCSAAMVIGSVASPLIGLPLVLGAAGIGAGIGGLIGSRVGSSAGTVSGALAEKERRERADKLEQEILASPQKQQEAVAAYRADPVVEKSDTVEETFATSKTKAQAFGKIVDWKTMLVTVAICATVGAIVCGGAFLIAGGSAAVTAAAGKGIALGWGALAAKTGAEAAIIGAGLGAASGVTFGIAYPTIFASLTQKVANLLSGKTVRGVSQFEHVKTRPEILQEASVNRAMSEQQATVSRIAANASELASAEAAPAHSVQGPVEAERLMTAGQQLAV